MNKTVINENKYVSKSYLTTEIYSSTADTPATA